MSHRNGKPKPSASERTWSRYRVRNDMETEQDKMRQTRIEDTKQKVLERIEWFKQMFAKKENVIEVKPID